MWIKEIIIDEKEIFKKVDIRVLFCSCLVFSNMTIFLVTCRLSCKLSHITILEYGPSVAC